MKDLNIITQSILAVEAGEESHSITTIKDVHEGPGQTIRAFYFQCNGRQCCLSYPVDESAAKLRNFFPKISVHLNDDDRWLHYDDADDFDMRETIFYSDPLKPNPVLLELLQDRVERVLAQYPTPFHRLLRTLEGHFGEAMGLLKGKAYPAQRGNDAYRILTGVMSAKHLLRDLRQ